MSLVKVGDVYSYDFWFNRKRYKKSTGLTNAKAAQKVEDLKRDSLKYAAAGLPDPLSEMQLPPTLSEAIPGFLAWSQRVHRKPTVVLHRSNCAALERYLGPLRLDQITRGNVQDFIVERSKESPTNVTSTGLVRKLHGTVSNVTVNRAVTTLRLLYGHVQGKYPRLLNPARGGKGGIKLLPEPEVQRIVEDDEFARYLKVAPKDLADVAQIIRERGPRPQDVCSLTIKQCDFEEDTMSFWPKPKPGLKVVAVPVATAGKNKGSSRTVVMSPTVRRILQERVAAARKMGTEFLFPMKDWRGRLIPGRSRSPQSLLKPHNRTIRKIGIQDRVRVYDLRHTFATNAIRNGVHLRVVQDILGHSDPKMTMRYTQKNDLVAQRTYFSRLEG